MTTWAPADLDPIVRGVLAGDVVGPVPSLLTRTDGQALIYNGEVHSIAGEPESGKGWLMLAEAARLLGEPRSRVLYIDFEDSPATIVGRLLALGAPPAAVIERFVYIKPEEPLGATVIADLIVKGPYALVILDGLSEAYALLGLDYTSNTDVPKFLQRLVRPLAASGAAVVQIDHVAKDKTTRGRFAIGAQHKLAGVAVSYGVEVIDRPSRTRAGKVKLILAKDRHGHVEGQVGSTIALATITPEDEGKKVTVRLDGPDDHDEQGAFRPTALMERVSRALEAKPGQTKRTVRTTVKGKRDYIDLALDLLVAEGFVRVEVDGQAHRHYSERRFREDESPERGPVAEPWPNRGPATVVGDRGPVALPLRGARARATVGGPSRSPDAVAPEDQRRLEEIVARNGDLA